MPFLGTTGGGSVKQYGGLANLGYFLRRSLKFNRSGLSYLTRTPASSGNRKTFTYSFWMKYSVSTDYSVLFSAINSGGGDQDALYIDNNSYTQAMVIRLDSITGIGLATNQVFRDPAAWYHVVMAMDTTQATATNRLKLYINGSEITSFQVDGRSSINQNSDMNGWNTNRLHLIGSQAQSAPAYTHNGYFAEINFVDGLQLTPSSFGKTDAATGQWIPKKYSGAYGTNGFYLSFNDFTAATAAKLGKDYSGNGNNWTPNNIGVASTNAYPPSTITGTLPLDKSRLFDGSIETRARGAGNNSTDNFLLFTPVTPISYTTGIRIHCYAANGFTITNYYSLNGGAEVSFVGGGDLFNSHTFITVASGSGTLNSLKVRLTRGSAGSAVSWSAIEVDGVILTNNADSVPDVPTISSLASNYCTLNPNNKSTSDVVLSNGNLYCQSNYASGWQHAAGTFAVRSGKWYWEAIPEEYAGTDKTSIGMMPTTIQFVNNTNYDIVGGGGYGITGHGAGVGGYSYALNDVVMIAVDADNNKVYYGKNGTWFGTGDPSAGTGGTTQTLSANVDYVPLVGGYGGSSWAVNFGQKDFTYTAPTGFKSLNTFNLP
jgi:hypothetical protein